jgi:hypothetical protein
MVFIGSMANMAVVAAATAVDHITDSHAAVRVRVQVHDCLVQGRILAARRGRRQAAATVVGLLSGGSTAGSEAEHSGPVDGSHIATDQMEAGREDDQT